MRHLEYHTQEAILDKQYETIAKALAHMAMKLDADGKLSVLGFGLLTDIVEKLELLGHEIEESYK